MQPESSSKTRERERERDIPGVIAWPPAIFLSVLAVGVVAHVLSPVQAFPPWPARIIGGGLVIAACALAVLAKRVMQRVGTNTHPWLPALALATTGPYRFTRNPMYLALCLLHLGIALLIDGLWPIATTVLLFAILWWGVVAREERYLQRKFGDDYAAYRRRVRRWL